MYYIECILHVAAIASCSTRCFCIPRDSSPVLRFFFVSTNEETDKNESTKYDFKISINLNCHEHPVFLLRMSA